MYRKEIKKYAKEIKKYRRDNFSGNKRDNVKIWDWPACVSICYGRIQGAFAKGYSHDTSGTNWFSTLKKKMEKIGIIGETTEKCDNILGKCAEQHSGNNYMKQFHENQLKNLNFSITIRPRTGQCIATCANCKEIFPNL